MAENFSSWFGGKKKEGMIDIVFPVNHSGGETVLIRAETPLEKGSQLKQNGKRETRCNRKNGKGKKKGNRKNLHHWPPPA